MRESGWWVDNAAHELHHGGCVFPCDRDVEAIAFWSGHALLLSSDTDCLSLWDTEGLVRTARVGVYPQDMAVLGDRALVCGGADGRIHLLDLPGLHHRASFPLPGMPERIALHDGRAYILTLLPEYEIQTALMSLDPAAPQAREITRFPGIPGALAADATGLWAAVSEMLAHIPYGASDADVVLRGFGLIQRIDVQADGIRLSDPLEGTELMLQPTADGQWSLVPADT